MRISHYVFAVAWFFMLPLWPAKAEEVASVSVSSVVMGTDGQMRARVNGSYLTRQQQKDGFRVLDMDYQRVVMDYKGQRIVLKPGERWSVSNDSSQSGQK
jgi:hypothetical protein